MSSTLQSFLLKFGSICTIQYTRLIYLFLKTTPQGYYQLVLDFTANYSSLRLPLF